MGENSGYSELFEEALRVATAVHRPQNRKGCDVPYITHPVHVAVILLRHGFPVEAAVAGLLHDVVEDQAYPIERIEAQFGPRVAALVAALTEQKLDDAGNKRPWDVRKQEAIDHIRTGSLEAAAVKAADALHNARSVGLDVRQSGECVWERFTRGPQETLGYYRRVLDAARERLGDHPLIIELADAVAEVAQAVDEAGSPSPV